MSAPKHRYELWSGGVKLAKYNTLGQALLGAVWRSKRVGNSVGVYKVGGPVDGECLAIIRGVSGFVR